MTNIKETVLDQVIQGLRKRIETAERGRSFAIAESQAHKGAMSSRYDTFKEEAQYLAGAHSAQLSELARMFSALQELRRKAPIVTAGAIYALIEIEDAEDGNIRRYLLLPLGGGDTYATDEGDVTVLNTDAPLARAFIGAHAGDEIHINLNHARSYIVRHVQ